MKSQNEFTDLSIIIPTYNRKWSLPQTLESCRNNRCHVEIIVIDDGSDDGTVAWLSGQKDIVVLQQPHLGKCWAVNKGFEIAKGKYIRFLDSDDAIEANANDEQFELAEATLADIVVSGYKSFGSDGKIVATQIWTETDDFIAQQLGECDSSHYSAYIFKKEFLNDIPHRPDFAFRDDRLFVLEAALKNPAVAIHKGTSLLHRVNHHDRLQASGGLKQQVQNYQHLSIYKFILGKLNSEGRLTERRIKASINVLWPLSHWIAKHSINEAHELVLWIYELDPGFKIPDQGIIGTLYKNIGFKNTEKLLKLRRAIKYHHE